MQKILIDTGPLVALFDRSEEHHKKTVALLKGLRAALYTTWPVLTEVTHLLDFSVTAQIEFLTWIQRGAVQVLSLELKHLADIIALTKKYADQPMDLADASLVLAARLLKTKKVITFDSDFLVYRSDEKKRFENIF